MNYGQAKEEEVKSHNTKIEKWFARYGVQSKLSPLKKCVTIQNDEFRQGTQQSRPRSCLLELSSTVQRDTGELITFRILHQWSNGWLDRSLIRRNKQSPLFCPAQTRPATIDLLNKYGHRRIRLLWHVFYWDMHKKIPVNNLFIRFLPLLIC